MNRLTRAEDKGYVPNEFKKDEPMTILEILTYTQECLDKLGKLEDKEEEVGMPLDEFIKKAIPTKPHYIYEDEPLCPNCGELLDDGEEHCDKCDQRIDWIY